MFVSQGKGTAPKQQARLEGPQYTLRVCRRMGSLQLPSDSYSLHTHPKRPFMGHTSQPWEKGFPLALFDRREVR